MSYKNDIRRLAKQDENKKGLSILQERPSIPASINAPINPKTEGLTPPLILEVLTTETVRVYQNNDDTSSNWVDVDIMLTGQFIDNNGKEYLISSVVWPE